MDPELTALTSTAATTVVQLLATAAWEQAISAVGGYGGPDPNRSTFNHALWLRERLDDHYRRSIIVFGESASGLTKLRMRIVSVIAAANIAAPEMMALAGLSPASQESTPPPIAMIRLNNTVQASQRLRTSLVVTVMTFPYCG